MIVKLLTEHHLEFLSLKGGCRGSSESTLVKMSNCWKSHAAAHLPFTSFHELTNVASQVYRSISVFQKFLSLILYTSKPNKSSFSNYFIPLYT